MKEDKYIKEAKEYVEKHFGGNYGNVENFWYPTNHKEAKVFLKHFIEKRFEKFGPYQDFMVQGKIICSTLVLVHQLILDYLILWKL